MLINSLKKFLFNNREKIDSNIVYNIVNNEFNRIIQANEKHEVYNIIEAELNKYINGESIHKSEVVDFKDFNMDSRVNGKVYISKIDIKGVKGIINLDEYVKLNEEENNLEEVAATMINKTHNYRKPYMIELEGNKSCLVFGWNGEGKSSLTEGIEFGLTGSTAEQLRRKRKCNEYLLNTNSKEGEVIIELSRPFSPPQRVEIIRNIDRKDIKTTINKINNSSEVLYKEVCRDISVYEDYFSKHFIERNRLEEFVLSKGEDKKRAYGKLLGLDELIIFIKNYLKTYNTVRKLNMFTKSGVKKNELKQQEILLRKEKENLIKQKSYNLENEEVKLICDLIGRDKYYIRPENFYDISIKLRESENKEKDIETSITNIKKIIESIDEYLKINIELNDIRKQNDNKDEYMKLYEFYTSAKIVVDNTNKSCPLCGNEIIGNDLLNLVERKLKELSEIKNHIENLDEIKKQKDKIGDYILNQVSKYYIDISKNDLEENIINNKLKNDLVVIRNNLIQKKSAFKNNINDLIVKIKNYHDDYATYIVMKKEQEKRISSLQETIDKLKEDVKNENSTNILKEKAIEDYKIFIDDINQFYNNEMKDGLKGISENIKLYYNKFETNNPIESVDLVENEGVEFIIKYNNDNIVDPLIVLSEGQLRCFGLAILLSISDKINANFLILDDIVNSIDIEHRANIIKVLCNEIEKPKQKQLIITTHDKLFREKFVNSISNKNKIKTYSFVSSNIILEDDTNSVIFENKIYTAIKNKDCRTALIYMRVLLENKIYSMADGKVPIMFYNQVYKYKLEKVFLQVAQTNPRIKKIYNYFINNNRLNWTILNQENHFWSEQSIALDSELINEIFEHVIVLSYIEQFEKLSIYDIEEFERQLILERPQTHKFSRESEVIELFIDNGEWNYKFQAFKKVLY